MNFNIKIFLLCPIPEEQKPINEYISLKENNWTNWITLTRKEYFFTLFRSFSTLFLICLTFTFEGVESFTQIVETIQITSLFSLLFLLVLLFYVITNWKQVNNRFNTSRLIYEEGSWYTSEVWEKPISLIKNDKLISSQIIQPILVRNITFLIFLVFVTIIVFTLVQIR
jgi:hypothetical protein